MGFGKEELVEKLVEQVDLDDNEQVQAFAGALATIERNQRRALRAHIEALGGDPEALDVGTIPAEEERVDAFTALLQAYVTDDAWSYWVEYLAPDDLESTDRAKDYAGMDTAEWERRVEMWADVYRDRIDGAEAMTDRELAARHVESRFGLSLQEFEEEVVAWSEGEVLEAGLAGPIQQHTEALQEATRDLIEEEGNDGE